MHNVFIIGSKGIPANYGGFETFVDKLTANKISKDISYHVSCLSNENSVFIYNNCSCFNIKVGNFGSAKAILYDIKSLIRVHKYIVKNKIENATIYILACRIGPFLEFYKSKLKKDGINIFVNPDGHEWKRSKWNKIIKMYWKFSEKLMIKNCDLAVCDSKEIEKYIKKDYENYKPKTMFIAYGAELNKSIIKDDDTMLTNWYNKNGVRKNEYYLIVGRFVPENNYELVIREFMKSDTKKDLVIITNSNDKFLNELERKTNFKSDKRIKFAGTLYNNELLKKVRENAFAYFHGHEVGGTNPSLLEALVSTKLNLLLGVAFNKEVAGDSALYFDKNQGNLEKLINEVENLTSKQIDKFGEMSYDRIKNEYSWPEIVNRYEYLFTTYKESRNEG